MRKDAAVAAFQSIQQPSVVEQIIETFKQGLIRGELKPGQRLPSELELSQQLGVGRSALREAMKVMQAIGVVTIRQGDGTYIIDQPSPTLLSPLVFAIMLEAGASHELFELRKLIEIGYCELAAQNASEADFARIEAAQQTLEAFIERRQSDIETLAHLDLDFHFAILDATHNPLVIKIGRTVEELYFVSIRNTLAREENLEKVIANHRAIVAAIRSGQPEAIRAAVQQSLLNWNEEVKRLADE
jgi:GntR family transcriptional repressor for pyruvate dehydrogenase complex